MGADGGTKGPSLVDVSVCMNQLQTVPVLSLSSRLTPREEVPVCPACVACPSLGLREQKHHEEC